MFCYLNLKILWMQWRCRWQGTRDWVAVLRRSTCLAYQDTVATMVPQPTGLKFWTISSTFSGATMLLLSECNLDLIVLMRGHLQFRLLEDLWSTMAWPWWQSEGLATWYPSTSLQKGSRWSTHSFSLNSFQHIGDGWNWGSGEGYLWPKKGVQGELMWETDT
jgi:hypothetical protein